MSDQDASWGLVSRLVRQDIVGNNMIHNAVYELARTSLTGDGVSPVLRLQTYGQTYDIPVEVTEITADYVDQYNIEAKIRFRCGEIQRVTAPFDGENNERVMLEALRAYILNDGFDDGKFDGKDCRAVAESMASNLCERLGFDVRELEWIRRKGE